MFLTRGKEVMLEVVVTLLVSRVMEGQVWTPRLAGSSSRGKEEGSVVASENEKL